MVVEREVECRSLLGRSRIYGVDYSINPYMGCEHGCAYCFARFMIRYAGASEGWGQFVNVKVNAPHVLERQLRTARKGLVLLSSVTDPYQPIESKYQLTRRSLELLLAADFPVSILTKSSLVLRDIDLIRKLSKSEVGLTMVTLDEDVARNFEPKASSIKERLETLRTLSSSGIETYAFIGPVLPYVTEESLEELIARLAKTPVKRILVDRLNIKAGNWRTIKKTLSEHYPNLIPKFEEALFKQSHYYERLKPDIGELCKKHGLMFEFCY